MRRPVLTAAAALSLSLLATPALAHVSVSPGEVASESYARFAFRTPHGCDGAATNEISIQIPTGVVSVKPEFVVGWDVATEIGPYDEPVELHGQEITEGVSVVTWTAQDGFELPDDQFREFGLSVKMPAGDAGTVIAFPTVQGCVDGNEIAWIDLDHEADTPAPTVTLTAAGDAHGHGTAAADEGDEADADHGEESSEAATDGGTESADAAAAPLAESTVVDDGTDPLTIVALVVGLLGLGVGAAGLSAARRAR